MLLNKRVFNFSLKRIYFLLNFERVLKEHSIVDCVTGKASPTDHHKLGHEVCQAYCFDIRS